MSMFYILLILVAALWFIDEILSKFEVRKFGMRSEQNPILRFLFKNKPKYVSQFKLVMFLVFLSLIYFIGTFVKMIATFTVAIVFIIYLLVVMHGLDLLETK